MKFFTIMSIMMSLMFMFMKHPLSMGLILILQTIMVSLITGLMINNFWFSFILLIIMLSGALVLFIYMASVASNEKFNPSIKMLYTTVIMTMIMSVMIMFIESNYQWMMLEKLNMKNSQVMSLIKLFNLNNMMITIMIVSYLFMTMIVITYIVNVTEGPLRTKN
uniref:NADH-ubiquinone oxidoreductase chain 6 n=1 Tax=Velinus nodipes TaxID=1524544 RepID=A0A343W8U9_9HEMI|nr:NADH dehydrogenase subunit 6 [Velinus nodipes]AVZ00789.1 NADH dehydrogenase subunit 6 [Velinus nodipes]